MIDLRQFKYFLAIVEHGSFSRAAAALNLSQPSLSVATKALETELGTPLLKRGMKGVELTDAGRIFERRARTTIREADRAFEEVQQAAAAKSGKVTFGINSVLTEILGNQALARFYRSHPNIDVDANVSAHPLSDLNFAIDGARWDFGIMLLRPDIELADTLSTEHLTSFDSGVYVSADHPLAGQSELSLADLSKFDWITSSASVGASFLFDIFDSKSVPHPRISTVTNSFNLIRDMAKTVPYLSLLPHPFALDAIAAGELVELAQPYISITSKVHLVYPKHTPLTPAASSLANVFREAAKTVGHSSASP